MREPKTIDYELERLFSHDARLGEPGIIGPVTEGRGSCATTFTLCAQLQG
jgi:hypothetical protein